MASEKELLLAVKDVIKVKFGLNEDEDCSHPLMRVRWLTMDSYISNLLLLLAIRASGKSLAKHPVINRLIECRVVLEKIRSLFKKQDKHIARLISMGKSIERGEDVEEVKEFQSKLLDIDNIDSDFDSNSEQGSEEDAVMDDDSEEQMSDEDGDMEENSDSDSDDKDDVDSGDEDLSNESNDESDNDVARKLKTVNWDGDPDEEIDSDEIDEPDVDEPEPPKKVKKGVNVYRPPKINPVYFDDDGGKKKKNKETKQSQEIERRLLQEEKLARLQETGDTPIEIKDYSTIAMKKKQKDREIKKYEEANMVRLNLDRKERRQRHNQMDEVMDLMQGKQDYPEDASKRTKTKKNAKRLKGKFKRNQRKRR